LSDITDELLGESLEADHSKNYLTKTNIVLVVIVLVLGWYVGILLFGNNSILRLIDLKAEHENLEKRVDFLKKDNKELKEKLLKMGGSL